MVHNDFFLKILCIKWYCRLPKFIDSAGYHIISTNEHIGIKALPDEKLLFKANLNLKQNVIDLIIIFLLLNLSAYFLKFYFLKFNSYDRKKSFEISSPGMALRHQ